MWVDHQESGWPTDATHDELVEVSFAAVFLLKM
jgi:hypothetical protein